MSTMPLFIDVHAQLPAGVRADDVAAAHRADLEVQQRHGVRYLQSWIDEAAGKLFCLVDALSAKAAVAVHREAHGLLADRIYEVRESA
jgi:hypothetical protein